MVNRLEWRGREREDGKAWRVLKSHHSEGIVGLIAGVLELSELFVLDALICN